MILIAFGVGSGTILLIFTMIELVNIFKEWKTRQLVKRYCRLNDLTVLEVNSFPGYYGLDFMHRGKKYYAGVRLGRNNTLKWEAGSPISKIQSGETLRKTRAFNERMLLFDSSVSLM